MRCRTRTRGRRQVESPALVDFLGRALDAVLAGVLEAVLDLVTGSRTRRQGMSVFSFTW